MIRFAPFSIPWRRRVQTLAVWSMFMFALSSLMLLILGFLNPLSWPIFLPYMIWVYFDKAPKRGGRRFEWVRKLSFWRPYAEYFPARLVKTAELDAREQYLFAIHPHGIISAGVWANILGQGGDSGGFDRQFPGINLRAVTLPINFYIPFWREFVLSMGLIDSSREAIHNTLNNKRLSVLIVPGGAAEALDSLPHDDHILTLKNRKGFVRMALIHGCKLVPVFSFGENEIYDQVKNPKGSRIRRLQDYLYRKVGVAFPLLKGRGMFNYNVGLLPHRHPIHTVIGAPISLPHISEPTRQQIDEAHQLYLDRLTELYDAHKEQYGSAHRKLIFV